MCLLLGACKILLQHTASTDDKGQRVDKAGSHNHQAIALRYNAQFLKLVLSRHAIPNVLSVGAELWYVLGAEGRYVAQETFDVR